MTKNPAWYRIQAWARKGGWEAHCNDHHHMAYRRDDDCIQLTLKQGRVATAEWHRHQPDHTVVVLGEQDTPSEPVMNLQEWFIAEAEWV